MTKQQVSKNASILFLISLALNIAIVVAAYILAKFGITMGIWATVLAEAALFIPTLLYLTKNGEPVLSTLGFHKIKVSTIFLTILLNIVITPIWMFGNVFSQLFVPNVVAQGVTSMMENSAGPVILVVSLLPPLFEEMFFRGLLFNKYKNVSTLIKAALLSAFFFGILHLNLNQFCYAFLLGVIFAFVNVASGSIVTSMIMHFLINAGNVLLLYVSSLAMQMVGQDAAAAATQTPSKSYLMTFAAVLLVLSVVAAFLAKLIMQSIAKREGHLEEFNSIFKKNSTQSEETVHIFRTTPSLFSTVLGVVSIAVISFYLPNVF
ncbi:lysostaphin resistance A-like protein [Butyrivibrio sp. JL13D10]|uniref:CPBP family intramembrane glutamic endopeptidase n=1 Tax=Butyrivibrio sp. JL13D10 TaxID=3236815 RepID=UPI0038B47661